MDNDQTYYVCISSVNPIAMPWAKLKRESSFRNPNECNPVYPGSGIETAVSQESLKRPP